MTQTIKQTNKNRGIFLFFTSKESHLQPVVSPDVILCGWLGLKHQLTN